MVVNASDISRQQLTTDLGMEGFLLKNQQGAALRYLPATCTTTACEHLGYQLARPDRARLGVHLQ